MKFAAWFGIIVGLLMVGQWTFMLAAGQVPELVTEPLRIAFHLAAELVTAISLLAGGIALHQGRSWAKLVYLLGAGMLIYSAIVSPGYFAQQGQWAFVGMFAGILIAVLASIVAMVRAGRTP